jgi:Domain of unknown function (DUF6089)
MRILTLSKPLVATISIFYFSESNAQKNIFSTYGVGINAGAYIYQGDLAPQKLGSLKTIKYGFGLLISKTISPTTSITAAFTKTTLQGDETKYASIDEYRLNRAFKFNTNVREFALRAEYNFTGNSEYVKLIEPYVFAGVGLNVAKVKRDYSNFDANYFSEKTNIATSLATEDVLQKKNLLIPVIPIGIGFKYSLNNNFSLNTEFNYRLMRSDYLDGYSISANPKKYDNYYGVTVGVKYKLANKVGIGCPKVKL